MILIMFLIGARFLIKKLFTDGGKNIKQPTSSKIVLYIITQVHACTRDRMEFMRLACVNILFNIFSKSHPRIGTNAFSVVKTY